VAAPALPESSSFAFQAAGREVTVTIAHVAEHVARKQRERLGGDRNLQKSIVNAYMRFAISSNQQRQNQNNDDHKKLATTFKFNAMRTAHKGQAN
jgi:hypothetical protein